MTTIALAHLPIALALCDEAWRLIDCSRAFALHLALPAAAARGRTLWSALGWPAAPELVDDAHAEVATRLASGPSGQGTGLAIHLRAQRAAGGGWQITLQAHEAHAQAAEALHATEERLRLAVEVARIALWDWDLERDAIYLNPEWAAMVGREREAYTASAEELARRVHPQDAERIRRAIFTALEGDDTCAAVYRVRTEGGGYRWVRSQGRVVARNAQGRALRMIGMYIDITEAKQAEEELRSARDAATSADRAKAAFLGRMSHELRTPLNAVLGMAQLLAMGGLNAAQARQVGTINDSGIALLKLIEDVLEFSRLRQGQAQLVHRCFDPARLGSEALARAERMAANAQIRIKLELHPKLPTTLTGDAERIDQVLYHLLANAFKFTPRGTVRLALAPLDPAAPLAGLVLEVADSGIGMDAPTVERLFAAFEQADGGSTRAFGGSGLGLALSHELVQLMGGSVSASSEPGRGSSFVVRLPLPQEARAG